MLFKTAYKMKPPVSARLKPGHPLADKLIACYLLNEGSGVKAFDASGRGHHGTLTGGAKWVMGKDGPAVDLDGTDGCIVINDHSDFTPTLIPLSISADVYMHDATKFIMASKGVLDIDGEWSFRNWLDDKIRYLQMDESEDACYIGRISALAITLKENKWMNVVAVYGGGITSASSSIYINGNLIEVVNLENNAGSFESIENLDSDVKIGCYSTAYADGVFGHLMIWRRVLTQSDIVKLQVDPFCMFDRVEQLGQSVRSGGK